jgi:YbbR domain-containing protein
MRSVWETIATLTKSNLGLKVLALVIAVGLWLAGHRDIERAVEVPVEFRNIPGDLMVTDNRIDYVVLRLTGPRTLVSTLDADDLKLSVDLKGAKSGLRSYPLASSSFGIPRGVAVTRITPPVIHLKLEPVMKRSLPVVVRLAGKPPAGYKITETVVEPETVSVQGPAEEVKRLVSVETLPIDIDDHSGPTPRKVRLWADGKPLSFTPEQVAVLVTLAEEELVREYHGVMVQAKDFAGTYAVNPRTVYLRLGGPQRILGKLELGVDQVYLNLKGLGQGEHSVPLIVRLPPEVRVLEQKPMRFKVRIAKAQP